MMRVTTMLFVTGLLAACTSTPLPFAIERLGTLPPDRYPALERLAASADSVISARGSQPKTAYPEPYWVYSVDPGLDLKNATLQVGQLTGQSPRAAEVAATLQPRLVADLSRAQLFASVGTAPVDAGIVMNGIVVRADTIEEDNGNQVARTQMEVTLSRNGKIVGAMQINSAQFDSNWIIPVAGALISAAGGSRVGSLAGKITDIFAAVAGGRSEGIDTETFSRRFLRTLPRTGSVFEQ